MSFQPPVNARRVSKSCGAPSGLAQLGRVRPFNPLAKVQALDASRLRGLTKAISLHLSLCFLVGSLTLLSGCGGGGATFQSSGDKTLGQELQDLQASYDKGIITQKQYEDIKKKLIKKYTK
jgi:hypothetical protein